MIILSIISIFYKSIDITIYESSVINFKKIPLFTSQWGMVLGVFAFSFFMHNIIITFMKNNKNQEKN